jgi:hypothetical protein
MRFRIASAMAALALAVSMTAVALAQADDGPPTGQDTIAVDTAVAAPTTDQPGVAPTLFLTLVNPVEQDVEVPLDTTQLTIQGMTLPGAVVSLDGDLVDSDDQGNFVGVTALDEGANEIEVVASDDQGNQVNTSIFVTRGE